MSAFIDRQKPIIERTGAGLLPGVGLALFIAMGIIAAILIGTWWATALALVGIFAVSGVVVWIIMGVIGSEQETYGDH